MGLITNQGLTPFTHIFFADIPYDLQINKEKYYQTIFYLIFSLIGLKVEAEVKTNKGRIDAVIIDKNIYIFEFKFNGDKNKALSQIKEKKYFEKYQGMRVSDQRAEDGERGAEIRGLKSEVGGLRADKEIYLFGVEFIDRSIGEWVVEKM